MPLPRARFVYDVSGTPVTYADLYDKPYVDACVITLASTKDASRFTVALDNIDGSKDSSISTLKEARVEIDPGTGTWQRMIEGYVSSVGKRLVRETQEKILVVKGISYGDFILQRRWFDFDYGLNSKLIRTAVVDDVVAGQGIAATNVQSSAIITEVTKKKYDARSRWDVLIDMALESGCDCFVDETRDLHFFKAFPDVNTPSTGRTFDDGNISELDFWEDSEGQSNKVYAIGVVQLEPQEANLLASTPNYWNALGFSQKTVGAGAPGTSAPAINFGGPSPAPAINLGRYSDAMTLNLLESDWDLFTFTFYNNLTGSMTCDLLLEDLTGSEYWTRSITSDLVQGTWKTLAYKLPTFGGSGWTTVGNPTKINKVKWSFTGVTGGDLSLQWVYFYRLLRKSSSVPGSPLLEKIITHPDITDAFDLNNLAAKELTRVKNTIVHGTIVLLDGDVSLRRPGHTATLSSTKLGVQSQTIRIDEILHRIEGKFYETIVSFSTSVAKKVLPSLREVWQRAQIADILEGRRRI